MNFSAPPECLLIDGLEYPIDTDFRRWVEFYRISKKGGDLEEFFNSMGLPFSKSAADAACDFFVGPLMYGSGGNSNSGTQTFDFDVDAEAIYSAFYGAFRIDLTVEQIHWWKFMALFRSLPQDCEMCRIMHYRAVKIKDVPKDQRKFYADMKARYSLADKSNITLKQRNEDMKRRVDEAYRKAESRMSEMRSSEQPSMD